jgi:acyl-coenzyme A thioesterase PaaI-like protein
MLTIPRRFNGPPASANGGYAAGLLAERLGVPSVAVDLRAPPPLDAALEVRRTEAGLALYAGDALLAEAAPAGFELEVPPSPGLAAAATAGAIGRMRSAARIGNPYRHCFGCGIERADGLQLLPGAVGDDGLVATDWTPAADLAGPDGTLPAPVVWAALDCPAGIAWGHRLPDAPPMMTARIAARLLAPVRAGEPHVVAGWPIARDGRKLTAGTAIWDAAGRLLACSLQLWLLPRPA